MFSLLLSIRPGKAAVGAENLKERLVEMSDSRALTEGQPTVRGHERSSKGRHHRHRPAKHFARKIKRYQTHILIVIGLIVLLVVWYLVASYEPKSPL